MPFYINILCSLFKKMQSQPRERQSMQAMSYCDNITYQIGLTRFTQSKPVNTFLNGFIYCIYFLTFEFGPNIPVNNLIHHSIHFCSFIFINCFSFITIGTLFLFLSNRSLTMKQETMHKDSTGLGSSVLGVYFWDYNNN